MQAQYPGARDEARGNDCRILKHYRVLFASVADLNEKCVQYGQAPSVSILGVASSLEDDGTRRQHRTNLGLESD